MEEGCNVRGTMEKTTSEIFANNIFSLSECINRFCKPSSLSRYVKFHWLLLSPVKKAELTAMGIRCADHATPSIRKSWH
jgi:hypothetical protein